MSIEIHCPKCSKVIRAPDNAGGKQGKCPYCDNRLYIPIPHDQVETLDLAPVDVEEERREEQLRRESASYAANVAHGTGDLPPDTSGSASRVGDGFRPPPVDGEVIDVHGEVKRFILAMRDSKLDVADQAVATLKRAGAGAQDYVQGLMVDEMPPEFENVPPPLLKGFLKMLSGRLG